MTVPEITRSAYYITFKLGDELFAIDVGQVREVLDLTQITRVPTAPAYMRGVVNVRGTAIPVVDLRLKFGLPRASDSVNSRILVLELSIDGERTIVGGLADSVHDVVEIEPHEIAEPPRIAQRWRSDVISGTTRRAEKFVIMLDINRVFATEGVALARALDSAEAGALAEVEAAP